MLFHSDNINYDDDNRLKCIYRSTGFYNPFNQNGDADVCKKVSKLCKKADVDMPNLYVLDEHQVGARTSTYAKHPSISLTSGALNRLNNQQLDALLAHEIAHIKLNKLHQDQLGKTSERLADKIGAKLTSSVAMISLLNFYLKSAK